MNDIEKELKRFKYVKNPTDIQFKEYKMYLERLDKFTMYHTEEEYRNVIPEGVFMLFSDIKTFGSNCDRSDLKLTHQILGAPFYKSISRKKSIFDSYHEDFDKINLDKLILLIKNFVVRFQDIPYHYPKNSQITTHIFQRISYEKNIHVTTNIPHKIILEPINLIVKLMNDTGFFDYRTDDMRGGWNNDMYFGGSPLSQLKEVLQCDIIKIDDSDESKFNLPYRVPYKGQKNDRYQIHIANKNQFVRLIKYPTFIFRYQPESDTLLLIYTPGGWSV